MRQFPWSENKRETVFLLHLVLLCSGGYSGKHSTTPTLSNTLTSGQEVSHFGELLK